MQISSPEQTKSYSVFRHRAFPFRNNFHRICLATYTQQVRREPQTGLYSFSFTRIQPTLGTFRPTVRSPLTISFIHIKPKCVHQIIIHLYTHFFQTRNVIQLFHCQCLIQRNVIRQFIVGGPIVIDKYRFGQSCCFIFIPSVRYILRHSRKEYAQQQQQGIYSYSIHKSYLFLSKTVYSPKNLVHNFKSQFPSTYRHYKFTRL